MSTSASASASLTVYSVGFCPVVKAGWMVSTRLLGAAFYALFHVFGVRVTEGTGCISFVSGVSVACVSVLVESDHLVIAVALIFA